MDTSKREAARDGEVGFGRQHGGQACRNGEVFLTGGIEARLVSRGRLEGKGVALE